MLSNFLKGFNKLAGHSNSRSPGDNLCFIPLCHAELCRSSRPFDGLESRSTTYKEVYCKIKNIEHCCCCCC